MKFGPVALNDAPGAILAHSIRVDGKSLKKGRKLISTDLEMLARAGLAEVTVARLEPADVHEDEAAQSIATALSGEHVVVAEPFTGRSNIYADNCGLALVDEARLRAINRLDERLTIASLPAFEQIDPRQMLATVKVIPFSVPRPVLDAALMIAREGPPIFAVAPFCASEVDMVITRLAQTKDAMLQKTENVVRERLERCGATLGKVAICAHSEDAVAEAVSATHRPGVPLLLFGASAIVDRLDVIPAGLEGAGGEVVHLGMPVDPGNLLMLGKMAQTQVIGVPSCARSPKLNGFDWVLQRVLAGLTVSGEDIMDMGAGGLLKEIPSRPRPREKPDDPEISARTSPRIAAVVLAAGRSTRMGPENKLLKHVDGEPLVRQVVAQAEHSAASRVIVVTGHEQDQVIQALGGFDASFVHNQDYRDGLSASLKAGIGGLPQNVDGALVVLGDMPLVEAAVMDKLISAFSPSESRAICVPVYQGKRGNPVLWGAEFFPEIQKLAGDIGAKHLLADFAEAVCEVEVDDPAILLDFDTPEAFSKLSAT